MTEAAKNVMIIALLAWMLFMAVVLSQPTQAGYWLAQRDIAYDSIMAEYMSDCDCATPLE